MGSEHKGATQQAAEAIFKGASQTHTYITAKAVAEEVAANINSRLNYQPRDEGGSAGAGVIASGVDGVVGASGTVPGEETFRKYEQELEINDFPQQARWRVTSKVMKFSYCYS